MSLTWQSSFVTALAYFPSLSPMGFLQNETIYIFFALSQASVGDGIPVELFQILKDDAVKVLHSICQNLENSAVATGLEKSVFIPITMKGSAKECSNYHTIALISHASKVTLKIL